MLERLAVWTLTVLFITAITVSILLTLLSVGIALTVLTALA